MTTKTALAFPATVVDALRFSERHRKSGWRVLGAASVPASGADASYDGWIDLPFVYEEGFKTAFAAVVAQERVSKVFSSHEAVSRYLRDLLPVLCPGVELETVESYRIDDGFLNLVAEGLSGYRTLAAELAVADPVTETEHLAVLSRAFQIRGESGVQKLSSLMAALGSTPRGDVVEIGALSGRSAFALGWLARRYQVGPVLCIDPWTTEKALQHDAPDLLQKASGEIDFADFFREFRLNLLPSFYRDLNYIRESASDVRPRYAPDFQVGPTEFGTTRYSGRIALLHIDGNHDYGVVSEDVALWWELVLPGGWIIIDDYVWPFGDGPRRAADELTARNPGAFRRSFVDDGALFLQRNP